MRIKIKIINKLINKLVLDTKWIEFDVLYEYDKSTLLKKHDYLMKRLPKLINGKLNDSEFKEIKLIGRELSDGYYFITRIMIGIQSSNTESELRKYFNYLDNLLRTIL